MKKLFTIVSLLCLPSFNLLADSPQPVYDGVLEWTSSSVESPLVDWANTEAFWLPSGELVLTTGNDSGDGRLHWLEMDGEQVDWQRVATPSMPRHAAKLAGEDRKLLFIGGKLRDEWTDTVIAWHSDSGFTEQRPLPMRLQWPTAIRDGGAIHLAGFDLEGQLVVWSTSDVSEAQGVISKNPLPPGWVPESISVVRQQDGDGHKLWVFAEGWIAKLYPRSGNVTFIERPVGIGSTPVRIGVAHVLLAQPGEPWFDAFHTVTGNWIQRAVHGFAGEQLYLGRVGDQLILVERNGSRIELHRGSEVHQTPRLSKVDFALLLLYFIVLILMGNWFRLRGKDTRDYFVGGNRVQGWAAGISIVLTNISAVSLLSLPAKAYATNWTFYIMLLAPLIAAPLVIRFILPFFYGLRLTTAFEYLQMRFNVWLRCLGSLQYMVYEICRMGVLILLPSIVLSVVTGIDIWVCILLIGVISTIYTLMGGLEAVVWTDVMQGAIMVAGIIVAIFIMFSRMEGGAVELLSSAWSADKMRMLDWSPTLSDVTVWAFLLILPTVMNNYVSHQPTVQRFISTRNMKDAARGLWTTGISAPLMIASIFLCGTVMFLFYQQFPERLNPTMDQPDQLFAWFIINELPVGMIGLLIGAIFATTMSSLDSGLSSMSSIIVTDFYRVFAREVSEKRALMYAKLSTVILGVMGTGFGLWLATMDVLSLFDIFIQFATMLTGGLAGIFFLGIFTRRANAPGAMIGWAVSSVLVYLARTQMDLQFFLYMTVGTVSCFVVGYLASLLIPVPQRSLNGLTLWTRGVEKQEGESSASCC